MTSEKRLTVRMEKADYDKLKRIAQSELRSCNWQVTQFIREGIQAYEARHGEMRLDKDRNGTVSK